MYHHFKSRWSLILGYWRGGLVWLSMHFTPSWGFCQKHHGRRLRRQSDLFRVRGEGESCHRWLDESVYKSKMTKQLFVNGDSHPKQTLHHFYYNLILSTLDVDVYMSYACVWLCNLFLRRRFSWYFYYNNSCPKNQIGLLFSLPLLWFSRCRLPSTETLKGWPFRATKPCCAENLRNLSLHWFSHVWEQSMTGRVEVQDKAIQ